MIDRTLCQNHSTFCDLLYFHPNAVYLKDERVQKRRGQEILLNTSEFLPILVCLSLIFPVTFDELFYTRNHSWQASIDELSQTVLHINSNAAWYVDMKTKWWHWNSTEYESRDSKVTKAFYK